MTEEGTITKVAGNKAWVMVTRSTMCEGCHNKSACHTLGGGKDVETQAINSVFGKVGDRVLLRISSSSVIKAAFLVYLLPIIALIVGSLWGMRLGERYAFDPELGAVMMGASSFIVAFLIVYLYGKSKSDDKNYMPEVIKIVYNTEGLEKDCSDENREDA